MNKVLQLQQGVGKGIGKSPFRRIGRLFGGYGSSSTSDVCHGNTVVIIRRRLRSFLCGLGLGVGRWY